MSLSQRSGGLFFLPKIKRRKKDNKSEEEEYKEKILCRFVLDGSKMKIGESIALDKDILIIKTNDKYLGVPLKHIEEEGKTLLVKGLVDRNKAEEMGEKWRNESFKKIDHPNGANDGFWI